MRGSSARPREPPLEGGCCGPLWPAQYSSVNSPVDHCRSLWSRSVSGPGVSGFPLGGSCDSPHSPSRVPGGFGPGPVPGGSGDSNNFLEKPTGSPDTESANAFISNRRGGVVEYKASGRCFIETVLGQQRLVSDPCRGLFRSRARASPSPNPLPHPLVLGCFRVGDAQVSGSEVGCGGVRTLRIRRHDRPELRWTPSVRMCVAKHHHAIPVRGW